MKSKGSVKVITILVSYTKQLTLTLIQTILTLILLVLIKNKSFNYSYNPKKSTSSIQSFNNKSYKKVKKDIGSKKVFNGKFNFER